MPSTRARKPAVVSPSPSAQQALLPEDIPPAVRKTARRAAPKKPATDAAQEATVPAAEKAARKSVAAKKATGKEPAAKAAAKKSAARKSSPRPAAAASEEPVAASLPALPVETPVVDHGPERAAETVLEPAPARRATAPRKRTKPVAKRPSAVAAETEGQPALAPAEPVMTAPAPVEPVPVPMQEAAAASEEAVPAGATPPPVPLLQPWSEVLLEPDAVGHRLVWRAGQACPEALQAHVDAMVRDDTGLDPRHDEGWTGLQALAAELGHEVRVDPAAWRAVARLRDTRWRVHWLAQAYPDGAASAALRALWPDAAGPLAPFHLEGALFAACAGRSLLADEVSLDPQPQALLAVQLMARHFGVQRVLVLCPAPAIPRWQRLRLLAGLDDGVQVRLSASVPTDGWQPEMVIVDDTQAALDTVSGADLTRLGAAYGLVLMQEPAERPEALAKWLAWLDIDGLGAARRFLQRHRTESGWQGLDRLRDTLDTVMLRRTRSRWLQPVPGRRDRLVWLPLEPAGEAVLLDGLRRLEPVVDRWQRVGYVPDVDQLMVRDVLDQWREVGSAEARPGLLPALRECWEQAGGAQATVLVQAGHPASAARLAQALAEQGIPAHAVSGSAVLRLGPVEGDAVEVASPRPALQVCVALPWPASLPVSQGPVPVVYVLTERGLDEQRLLLRCCDAQAEQSLADPTLFCQGAALERRMKALSAMLARLRSMLLRDVH